MVELLALVVGVLSLFVSVFVYLKGAKPKRLEYESTLSQSIVRRPAGTPDISVHLGDRTLEEPRLLVARVMNAGKTSFEADAFEEPLSISVTGCEVLSATITLVGGQSGKVWELDPERSAENVVVAPKRLLNPGDSLEFRLLVEGRATEVTFDGRVTGTELLPAGSARLSARASLAKASTVASTFALIAAFGFSGWFAYDTLRSTYVPFVVGETADAATSRIEDAGLDVVVRKVESYQPADVVVEQSRVAGSSAHRGDNLIINVSVGPPAGS